MKDFKDLPRVIRRCKVCNTIKSYTNPMAKCSVCKEYFCYDHIIGIIETKGVIDYCQEHSPKKF
jgi:hypothetical protein